MLVVGVEFSSAGKIYDFHDEDKKITGKLIIYIEICTEIIYYVNYLHQMKFVKNRLYLIHI